MAGGCRVGFGHLPTKQLGFTPAPPEPSPTRGRGGWDAARPQPAAFRAVPCMGACVPGCPHRPSPRSGCGASVGGRLTETFGVEGAPGAGGYQRHYCAERCSL